MDFGIDSVRRGLITADQYNNARDATASGRADLSALSLTSHKLGVRQVLSILDVQVDLPKPCGQPTAENEHALQDEVRQLRHDLVDESISIQHV
jgi:hypothetical protein